MLEKIRVGILFGGRSAEHEVSLQSAKNIIEGIDRSKYIVVLIGVEKTGQMYLFEETNYLLDASDPKRIRLNKSNIEVAFAPGRSSARLVVINGNAKAPEVDVVFPVLHGPFGEDGSMQGLLKSANLPFVGCGILASAVAMDKVFAKRLFKDSAIPTNKFMVVKQSDVNIPSFEQIKQQLGMPVFIKPANLGSSVGVNKVTNVEEYQTALQDAFQYDVKAIIEEFIEGRELECAVLGNAVPRASGVGEVVPTKGFYSYQAKYIDEDGALLKIPAEITNEQEDKIKELAIKAFQALGCEGMARCDFFLTSGGKVLINEINTIPGFTNISQYPKLWEKAGLSCRELIDQLIQLAIERFNAEQKLKVTVE